MIVSAPVFTFQVVTRNGVLVFGHNADFLALIVQARACKARFSADLPHARLRVRLLYPNGDRVPSIDIKTALQALANPAVQAVVMARFRRAFSDFFDTGAGRDFSQAGVVAPPDSPDLGKTPGLSGGARHGG